MNIKPCDNCGKELVWGAAPWPVEARPSPTGAGSRERVVFRRLHDGRIKVVDVRDIIDPPDMSYPRHVCRVWHEQQRTDAGREQSKRMSATWDRLTG